MYLYLLSVTDSPCPSTSRPANECKLCKRETHWQPNLVRACALPIEQAALAVLQCCVASGRRGPSVPMDRFASLSWPVDSTQPKRWWLALSCVICMRCAQPPSSRSKQDQPTCTLLFLFYCFTPRRSKFEPSDSRLELDESSGVKWQ